VSGADVRHHRADLARALADPGATLSRLGRPEEATLPGCAPGWDCSRMRSGNAWLLRRHTPISQGA
jgi:hypothetical protein